MGSRAPAKNQTGVYCARSAGLRHGARRKRDSERRRSAQRFYADLKSNFRAPVLTARFLFQKHFFSH